MLPGMLSRAVSWNGTGEISTVRQTAQRSAAEFLKVEGMWRLLAYLYFRSEMTNACHHSFVRLPDFERCVLSGAVRRAVGRHGF